MRSRRTVLNQVSSAGWTVLSSPAKYVIRLCGWPPKKDRGYRRWHRWPYLGVQAYAGWTRRNSDRGPYARRRSLPYAARTFFDGLYADAGAIDFVDRFPLITNFVPFRIARSRNSGEPKDSHLCARTLLCHGSEPGSGLAVFYYA